MYSNLYGQIMITDRKGNKLWVCDKTKCKEALVEEHRFLLNAIREGRHVNKVNQLVNSTLLAIAGRMSAYSGKKFKFDWVLAKSQESFCPEKIDLGKRMPWTGVPVPGKYQLV